MARTITTGFLDGPAGKLEARLEEPGAGGITDAAIVCHPHPRHGGTMFNKVVHRLARGLRRTGSVTLRFNYRGVNLSEGEYDRGVGEVEDARAALMFLRKTYPGTPLTAAGFSFGSRIVLKLGCEENNIARVIAVGFPTEYQKMETLGGCHVPRYFIQSTNDEFGPRGEMQRYVDGLEGPKRLMWVSAADHFFSNALDIFEETVTRL